MSRVFRTLIGAERRPALAPATSHSHERRDFSQAVPRWRLSSAGPSAAPCSELASARFAGAGSGGCGVADGRRQRDARGPQGQAGRRARRRANDEAFAVVRDLGLGQ